MTVELKFTTLPVPLAVIFPPVFVVGVCRFRVPPPVASSVPVLVIPPEPFRKSPLVLPLTLPSTTPLLINVNPPLPTVPAPWIVLWFVSVSPEKACSIIEPPVVALIVRVPVPDKVTLLPSKM